MWRDERERDDRLFYQFLQRYKRRLVHKNIYNMIRGATGLYSSVCVKNDTLLSALQLRNSVMLASKGNLWICSLFCGTSEFNELISEFSPRYKNLLFYSVTPYYQWYMRLQSYHKMSITKQQNFFRIISPLIDTLYCGNIHHLNWHLKAQSSIKSD